MGVTPAKPQSHAIRHNFSMCGRYRLSRRKQIIEDHFDALSGEEDWNLPRLVIRQNSVRL
jgi:hypothetical protein